ncbi:hypothetical protein NBRC10512_002928 [Rhodotorula toruloides]|uniref:RHTO0S10e06920g1_1 n=2 Tax=Rhodotorula toruloides TaxID=5286 RepID=A0A061B765_RHOTO|nr:uncharacterized protein RHTO_08049 [Rhodotorula toruloides NP11]EMS22696.1 hypothetical protein RHTO_08049 [Rhodotorula toruloides NP11]CDR45226.1 RHTO0S10e06920g1_1 [Rhodotorula toruloides]
MSEVHAVDQEPVAIHDQQEERADEGANEPVLFAEPTEEGVEFDWPVGDRDRGPTFREMLESLNDPIPTYDELEDFGLFDHTHCSRLLADYRLKNPSPAPTSPLPQIAFSPACDSAVSSRQIGRAYTPRHRHSLSVLPVPQPQSGPPLASPSIAPRLNPPKLVRKATARPRPSHRAKSASEVPLAENVTSMPPRPSFDSSSEWRHSVSLSRNETVKENRGVRKLRKQAPPRITVRTDDDYLLRPFNDPPHPDLLDFADEAKGPSSLQPATILVRPSTPRRSSGRSSVASFVTSPLAYEPNEAEAMSPPPRPSSPVSSFPSSARRATLPPVETKKRGSTISSADSSYYADNERARMSPRAPRTGRWSMAAPPSPSGSTSSNGMWSKAIKLGRGKRGSESRASSVTSLDSPVGWEMLDYGQAGEARSFEVLGRPLSRPQVERAQSADIFPSVARVVSPALTDSSLSSSPPTPNLDRIVEQPETPDKRRSLVSKRSSRQLAKAISHDSLPPSSGTTTPAIFSAASSITAGERDSPVRPPLSRSRRSSNLVLASTHSASAPPTPAIDESRPIVPCYSANSLAESESWMSSMSSQSRDSLFYSGDETPASSSAEVDEDAVGAHTDDLSVLARVEKAHVVVDPSASDVLASAVLAPSLT